MKDDSGSVGSGRGFLRSLWPSRIRTQLICGVALVHLLLMTLFVFDLVDRQRNFLKTHTLEQTKGLALTLAVNSSSWVLASDVVGLAEIVRSVRHYPGIRYVMVTARSGKVLAHTDESRIGMYLSDQASRTLLDAPPTLQVLHADTVLLDVAAPVLTTDGDLVGWARVGQGQEQITKNLKVVSRNGILYTLLAIGMGSFLAILIGNRLLSGLNGMLQVAGQIRDGRRDVRMAGGGNDEIARLSDGFNLMLDAMIVGEANLQKSAAEIHDLYNHAPCGYHSLDPSGLIVQMNDTELQWLGYHRDEVVGKMTIHHLLAPENDRSFEANFRKLKECGALHDVDLTMLRKDGTSFSALLSATAVTDPNGAFVMTRSTIHDITDRLRAEEELRRIRNYLANIIDSMPSILVGMEPDGTVSQWNRQAAIATGVPISEAVGRPVDHLLPEFSSWIRTLHREAQQHQPTSLEKLLVERNGERRFYDLMLYPLVANCVEGAVVRIEDVTERALVQELMVQTEKMMSVGGLAAGMAHEINNPLGIIAQSAQNIERRVSPELPANRQAAAELGLSLELLHDYFEQRQIIQFLASIREASARASRIVANMLQFSRRSEPVMLLTPLGELVDRTVELAANDYDLKKKFDFRSIDIIRDFPSDIPAVPVIGVEIEQVVLNLLKNAAQAMTVVATGERPQIRLRLRREDPYVVLDVEDNGPGMDETVRLRVFEPFFTTKEPGVGTGLGLSVSYLIVTGNHRGIMTVASSPGRGACFTIKLPLVQER